MPTFRETIQQHLKRNIDPEFIPKGYKRIGNIMVLRNSHEIPKEIGEVALRSFHWCRGVFQQVNTRGENRRPIFRHLAGSTNTETTHRENGVTYILDAAKITFSGGNSYLRKRLVSQIQDGERLLDMFAAVGNLSLQPIFYKNVDFILIEKDPYTFEYLLKTLRANEIDTSKAWNMDCRNLEIEEWADRIFMGFHGVEESHLRTAVKAMRQDGTIHLHPLEKKENLESRINGFSDLLIDFGCKINDVTTYKIKKFSPGLQHYELIFNLSKT